MKSDQPETAVRNRTAYTLTTEDTEDTVAFGEARLNSQYILTAKDAEDAVAFGEVAENSQYNSTTADLQ